MAKKDSNTPSETIKIHTPKSMEYFVDIDNDKKRFKFIKRI